MTNRNSASVHRFGDTVAVYIGNGETRYLTPHEALKLGKALRQCAKSCVTTTWAKSSFKTVSIEIGAKS